MKQLMEYLVELELAVPIEQPEPGYWMVGLLGDRQAGNAWHPSAQSGVRAVLGRRVRFRRPVRQPSGVQVQHSSLPAPHVPVGVFPRVQTVLFQALSPLAPTHHMDACQLLASGMTWGGSERVAPHHVYVRHHPSQVDAIDVVVEGSVQHSAALMDVVLQLVHATCHRLCPADLQVAPPTVLCPRCLRRDQLDGTKCSWAAAPSTADMSKHALAPVIDSLPVCQ